MAKGFMKLLPLCMLMTTSVFAQDLHNANSDIKVKATINAGCLLTTENINFGVLSMPISNQSTTSNMQVKCSKGVASIIQISYTPNGAISTANYTATEVTFNGATHYKLYKDGVGVTGSSIDIACNALSQVFFYNQGTQNLYGVQGQVSWVPDTWNICSGVKINTTTLSNLGTKSEGVLTGIAKGDKVIYSLEVPNSSGQTWNVQNKYSFTTTGDTQTIPMKANVKSAGNPTNRLAPDTYQDILTVVLTY